VLVIKRATDILASGSLADAIVMRLELNGATLIEEGECVRADYISIFDRGNRRNEVSFTIGKLHDSHINAENHRLTHAQLNLGRADLIIELTENGVTFVATLANAGWRSIRPKRTGIYSMTDYEVVGGQFTTENASSQIIYDCRFASGYEVHIDCNSDATAAHGFADTLLNLNEVV
jgi:hypothetical protein